VVEVVVVVVRGVRCAIVVETTEEGSGMNGLERVKRWWLAEESTHISTRESSL
jgi:hypothetical protein